MSEVLIIENTEPIDSAYNKPLIEAVRQCGKQPNLIPYRDASEQIDRLNQSGSIILSGVPLHYPVKAAELRQPYISDWLPTITSPVLGICLGHQSIGLLFDATIMSDTEAESGDCLIEIVQNDKIFTGLQASFQINSSHWASISVPPGFTQLARSTQGAHSTHGCDNQVMLHPGKLIYGCQFHPELSENGMVILNNFLRINSK